VAKQTKITKSARGQDCQIRIPGYCNRNPETVVFCHLSGGGIGAKVSDIHGAYGCSDCHDIVDRRVKAGRIAKEDIDLWFLEAVIRTQLLLIEQGLIKL